MRKFLAGPKNIMTFPEQCHPWCNCGADCAQDDDFRSSGVNFAGKPEKLELQKVSVTVSPPKTKQVLQKNSVTVEHVLLNCPLHTAARRKHPPKPLSALQPPEMHHRDDSVLGGNRRLRQTAEGVGTGMRHRTTQHWRSGQSKHETHTTTRTIL
jgi:hypothetical protein